MIVDCAAQLPPRRNLTDVLATGDATAIRATWAAFKNQARAMDSELTRLVGMGLVSAVVPEEPEEPERKKPKKAKTATFAEPVEVPVAAIVKTIAKKQTKKELKALKKPRPLSAYNVFMSETSAKLKKKNWNPEGLEGQAVVIALVALCFRA